MPNYFLHVVDRGNELQDDHGVEAADLKAARAEAFRVIAELLLSGSWDRDDAANHINIVDGDGTILDTVAVWEVTSRPD